MFWDSTVTLYVFFLHCFVLFRDSTRLSKVAATDGTLVFLGNTYHSGDKAFRGRLLSLEDKSRGMLDVKFPL